MKAKAAPCLALCCECGQRRTYKQARNTTGEWNPGEWERMTGDLKCSACGRITRHALLRDSDDYQDVGERFQRLALGGPKINDWDDVERFRREYRQGLPRNPLLRHRFYCVDIDELGDVPTEITGLCGEVVRRTAADFAPVRSTSPRGQLRPRPVQVDEHEDVPWRQMDCVDCLRVSNDSVRAERRQEVGNWLAWALAQHLKGALTDAEIDALYDVLGPMLDR